MAYPKLFWKILFVFSPVDFIKLPPIVRTFEKKTIFATLNKRIKF